MVKFHSSLKNTNLSTKNTLKTSEKGILLIKNFEGLRLKAYQCTASVWTIGWGTTMINGFKVKSGDIIDLEMAEKLFRMDLEKHEAIINSKLQISLNQLEVVNQALQQQKVSSLQLQKRYEEALLNAKKVILFPVFFCILNCIVF